MTELSLYTALQYDLNKVEAPAIYVDDFNHFATKAHNQYINKKYNVAETKQQISDDLQAFTSTIIITRDGKITNRKGKVIGATTICKTDLGLGFDLPHDYLHLLGCVVAFEKCNAVKAAKRLTSDINGFIQDNAYLEPSYNRPYYFISENYLEIRSGNYEFTRVTIDYLKEPSKFSLTEELIDSYTQTGIDNSNKLPYADYIAFEILRELTSLVLEMSSDPRLNTNPIVTQSIN